LFLIRRVAAQRAGHDFAKAKLLDLFKNLAVLSQVPLNLPDMAANSLFSGKLFGN
jgi:hypothetical protein